jgi:uncharacterized protein (UPF0276 family)
VARSSEILRGVGLGLRWEFLDEVLERPDLDVAFFEVCPENYMRRGGWFPAALERVAERRPIVTHGLTMSLGGTEPPSKSYLDELRTETRRLGTPWHSDHLCFSVAGGRVLHDLLPVKHCAESARRVAERLRHAEDALGVPMLVENITYYVHAGAREMPESELIGETLRLSGSGLLLDVNNVWVNAQNHGFDPYSFIASLPLDRVRQIHVAGHTHTPSGLILDTHGAPLASPVLDLFEWTIERTGPVAVLLERDHAIPSLDELMSEVRTIDGAYRRALRRWEGRHARSA